MCQFADVAGAWPGVSLSLVEQTIQEVLMAHIHTLPGQYDLTVSAYVIRYENGHPLLLLHRHKVLGVWMQPGGHVELTEDPWQAVAHELCEETGYDLAQMKILQPAVRPPRLPGVKLHPLPACLRSFPFGDLDHQHTDLSFVFATDQVPLGRPGQGESTAFRWVDREALIALPAAETYEDVRTLGLYIIDTLLNAWEAVEVGEFD